MKKRLAPAALAVAAALLAGCGTTALPYAREMGDMALLRTMGAVSYTHLTLPTKA